MKTTHVVVPAKEADAALAPVGGLSGIMEVIAGLFGGDDEAAAEAGKHPIITALGEALAGGKPVTLTIATSEHTHAIELR